MYTGTQLSETVTRSVLASELYGMVGGFDSAIALSTTLQQIVGNLNIPAISVVICVDSKSLHDHFFKLGTVNKKRLMIDIMSIRESYEKREITEIMKRDLNAKKPGYSAQSYIETLKKGLLPNWKRSQLFMQNGAGIHRARVVRSFFELHHVTTIDWSPYSPDLNPIEHL